MNKVRIGSNTISFAFPVREEAVVFTGAAVVFKYVAKDNAGQFPLRNST